MVMEKKAIVILFGILLCIVPPVLSGLFFARLKFNLTRRWRYKLAFWGSMVLTFAFVVGPSVVVGGFRELLVSAILGWWIFVPFAFLAVVVCWLAMIKKDV